MELERRIKVCRKSLNILESRLDSLPFPKTTNRVSVVPSSDSKLEDKAARDETEPIQRECNLDSVEDPRLTRFYKMLKVGVPPEAVKIKMMSEEIDPGLLIY